jgi:hypothetical protein
MADFHYGGTDEESAEIKKLNAEIVSSVLLAANIMENLANCSDFSA